MSTQEEPQMLSGTGLQVDTSNLTSSAPQTPENEEAHESVSPPGSPTFSDLDLSGTGSDTDSGSEGELTIARTEKPKDEAYGITPSGERFKVPETYEAVEVLQDLRKYTEGPVIAQVGLILFCIVTYFMGLPRWFYAVHFLLWRFLYNVGIGYILYNQSNSSWFTNLFTSWISNPKNKEWFERNVSTKEDIQKSFDKNGMKKLGSDALFDISKYPTHYSAWMAFRIVVDIILGIDLVSYIVFAIAFTEVPSSFGLSTIFEYVFGFGLIAFNVWAKKDALRVIGDYAWYWGDFFFLLDKQLIFDGIFQMFPHPMYTVGYSFYYGLSLITRSYYVLLISFIAHMAQLSFLVFVENPHIEKTYGAMTSGGDESRNKILSSYFRKKEDLIMLKNLDIFKASDLFLVVIIAYNVFLAFLDLPAYYYVFMVIAFRLIHTVGLGYILQQQHKKKLWTNHWLQMDGTKQQAFDSWKKLYNGSLTINHLVFCICAIKLASGCGDITMGSCLVTYLGGAALIGLNIWGSMSTYEVLEDFGWFYGDFFIEEIPPKLYYTGIYRYLNNPELVLGFAAYYGAALISHSWVIFFLAAFSQAMSWAFVQVVEKPHMQEKYGKEKIRQHGGISRELRIKLKKTIVSSPTVSEWAQKTDKILSKFNDLRTQPLTQEALKDVLKFAAKVIKEKPATNKQD